MTLAIELKLQSKKEEGREGVSYASFSPSSSLHLNDNLLVGDFLFVIHEFEDFRVEDSLEVDSNEDFIIFH